MTVGNDVNLDLRFRLSGLRDESNDACGSDRTSPPCCFTGLLDSPLDAVRRLHLFERDRTYSRIGVNVVSKNLLQCRGDRRSKASAGGEADHPDACRIYLGSLRIGPDETHRAHAVE